MVLLFLLQFLTFLTNAVLGFFVLIKNPKKDANRAFFVFSVGVAGWNLSLFLTLLNFINQTLFWSRITFSFGAIMAWGLLWFVHIFPEETKHARVWKNIARFSGIIFFLLAASPFMIKSATVTNGYITGEFVPQTYLLWTAYFLLSLFYSLVLSWRRTIKSRGLAHSQTLSVSIGITLFLLPFLLTNLILPIAASDFRWNNLGPVFTIFLIGFIAHAIIKYRFLDIRWVVKRSFDFIFLWTFVFLVILGFEVLLNRSINLNATLNRALTSLAIAVLFGPVATTVNRITARVTARGSYIYEDAVSDVSDVVHSAIGLEQLQAIIADKLRSYFGFAKISIASFAPSTPDQPLRMLIRGFDRSVIRLVAPGVRFCLMKDRAIIEASELRWKLENGTDPANADCDRQVLTFMTQRGIAVMVPFVVGRDLVGLMLLGEKPDKSILSDRDLSLLRVIQGTAAPAMANGVRYAEVKRLYTQLASLDKAKSEFINVVSHQFRTPLTAILWNAELSLDGGALAPKDHKFIEEIRQRATFLGTTLNRIFDLLALENKQLTFESKPVQLDRLVQSIERDFATIARVKQLKLSSTLKPLTIDGDEEKVSSIVRTLIDNACNFSKARGTVAIHLATDASAKRVVLSVTDHGIGIAPDELPHVFDKFYRSGSAKKAAPDGAGISLYLAKQFIERQRGTIEVTSEPRKGTTFTVTFPVAKT